MRGERALICEIRRNARYRADDYADLALTEQVDAGDVMRRLRKSLDDAEAFVGAMPFRQGSSLFLKEGIAVLPEPDKLTDYVEHDGRRRGHWPSSPDIGGAMLDRDGGDGTGFGSQVELVGALSCHREEPATKPPFARDCFGPAGLAMTRSHQAVYQAWMIPGSGLPTFSDPRVYRVCDRLADRNRRLREAGDLRRRLLRNRKHRADIDLAENVGVCAAASAWTIKEVGVRDDREMRPVDAQELHHPRGPLRFHFLPQCLERRRRRGMHDARSRLRRG